MPTMENTRDPAVKGTEIKLKASRKKNGRRGEYPSPAAYLHRRALPIANQCEEVIYSAAVRLSADEYLHL